MRTGTLPGLHVVTTGDVIEQDLDSTYIAESHSGAVLIRDPSGALIAQAEVVVRKAAPGYGERGLAAASMRATVSEPVRQGPFRSGADFQSEPHSPARWPLRR